MITINYGTSIFIHSIQEISHFQRIGETRCISFSLRPRIWICINHRENVLSMSLDLHIHINCLYYAVCRYGVSVNTFSGFTQQTSNQTQYWQPQIPKYDETFWNRCEIDVCVRQMPCAQFLVEYTQIARYF